MCSCRYHHCKCREDFLHLSAPHCQHGGCMSLCALHCPPFAHTFCQSVPPVQSLSPPWKVAWLVTPPSPSSIRWQRTWGCPVAGCARTCPHQTTPPSGKKSANHVTLVTEAVKSVVSAVFKHALSNCYSMAGWHRPAGRVGSQKIGGRGKFTRGGRGGPATGFVRLGWRWGEHGRVECKSELKKRGLLCLPAAEPYLLVFVYTLGHSIHSLVDGSLFFPACTPPAVSKHRRSRGGLQ